MGLKSMTVIGSDVIDVTRKKGARFFHAPHAVDCLDFTDFLLLLMVSTTFPLKFGYSEKATKFEKIFHLKFNVTEYRQILSGRFFQISWPS